MGNATGVRLRIDTVASHMTLVIRFLAIHLPINAVACGVREHFECFVESFSFRFRKVGARPQKITLLDNNFKEILSLRINLYRPAQLDFWCEATYLAVPLNTKCVYDSWDMPSEKHGRDHVRQ